MTSRGTRGGAARRRLSPRRSRRRPSCGPATRRFPPRIAGRDLLAAAQDRGGVAEPFHLFELVADVKDRAAFGLQPLQHDKELVGLLRRQHRGRLVEDQKFRVLHQRPHDLDALAFADRQPPHLALGFERQPVNCGPRSAAGRWRRRFPSASARARRSRPR